MKRIILLLTCVIALGCHNTFAKDIKRPDSYNYTRGVEAASERHYEEALEYLNKELKDNPENGYAYAWIAAINTRNEDYGKALTAANMAIKLISKKDKDYCAFTHITRADIYYNIDKTENALSDLDIAAKYTPEDADIYSKRAYIYYKLENYDLSDRDYKKMISIDEGDVLGYMGLGRNAKIQENYNSAIDQFDYVIKLASDYSSAYSFRAESKMKLKMYNEAIDDIIKALEIDGDNKAFYLMIEATDSVANLIIPRMKVMANKKSSEGIWPYYLGVVYEQAKQYKEAIEAYKKSNEEHETPITHYRIASCYEDMGNYASAIEFIDYAIEGDSEDDDFILAKANMLYALSDTKGAIEMLDKYIEMKPNYFYGYYKRGYLKDNSRDVGGAIDDYSTAIALNGSYAYAYLGRADMYVLKNEMELANGDYKQVVALDSVPNNNSCAPYAFLAIGEKEKAIDFMNRIIDGDIENKGNYYDAACLYSRMGEQSKALEYLEMALKKGYSRYSHIENDDDLDGIRNLPEYKELIAKYKDLQVNNANGDDNTRYETRMVEVPFTKDGSVCKVNCAINNLQLHFVFDTGASDVSLSSVEADFMLKNGFIKSDDILGKQNYVIADGSLSEGTIVNLRTVNFGGLELNNIKASVVKNQSAPLLLGQSVIGRLGKIEIDNGAKVLKITYKQAVVD